MTHNTEALRGLLAKVEAATGPDRELDAQILCVLLAPSTAYVDRSPFNGAWCIYEAPASQQRTRPRLWEAPLAFRNEHASVTASIDAALALVERVLPGWILDTLSDTGTGKKGAIRFLGSHVAITDGGDPVSFDAATRPLAILGSLLTAALAQGGHHEA